MRVHRQLGQAARLWETGGREPSDLYRGARLAAAAELGVELNATERAFLDASSSEAGRERRSQVRANRRLRALLLAATLLLGVAIAGGVLALGQRDNARRSQAAAEAQSLTSDAERVGALALGEPTLDRSLLLAAAGVTLQDRPATRGDLLTILQQNPAVIRTLRLSARPGPLLRRQPRRPCAGQRGRRRCRALHRPAHLEAGRRDRQAAPPGRGAGDPLGAGRSHAGGGHARAGDARGSTSSTSRAGSPAGSGRGRARWARTSSSASRSPSRRTDGGSRSRWPTGPRPLRRPTGPWPSASWRSTPAPDVSSGGGAIPSGTRQMEAHVLFGRDGALITSAPQGATLVWNARSGRIVRRYPIGGRPALSPDGRTLALALNSYYAGDPSAALGLLDLRTGHLRRLKGNLPSEWIMSLAFARNGKQIVGPSFGGTHVWDVASGEVVDTYGAEKGLSGANSDLVIDRRGLALFTSGDGTVTAWDPEGARRVGREFPMTDDSKACPDQVCMVVADPHSPVQAVSLRRREDRAAGSAQRTVRRHPARA